MNEMTMIMKSWNWRDDPADPIFFSKVNQPNSILITFVVYSILNIGFNPEIIQA